MHANADGLSRLPLPTASESKVSDADVFTVAQVDSLPVTADQIERATRRDPVSVKCGAIRRMEDSGRVPTL